MRIAFIGCGYVADFYIISLKNYPELELAGVFDKNAERAVNFATRYHVHAYTSLDALLADPNIQLIVNLTHPQAHYAVTKACLLAGKHVYSEKPMATTPAEAKELAALAKGEAKLAAAPATLLGDTAQTVWKLLREHAIGTVNLAYAEIDDGAIYQMNYHNWVNPSGIPWPYVNEFETGSVVEHANYQLTWLAAFFGPAQHVTTFSSCLVPDKLATSTSAKAGDDFALACIQFASGTVARLTCSTLAPENRSLTLVGSEGVITVEDTWHVESPVFLQKRLKDLDKMRGKRYLSEKIPIALVRPYGTKERVTYQDTHDLDPARGIADLADAIVDQRSPRLSAELAIHTQEIISIIIDTPTLPTKITSDFPHVIPMI